MGTFHDTNDPLHGITVAARIADVVYVGRCHERSESEIVLMDADEHLEGQEGKSNDEYLARAARFGVWKKHDRLVLPAAEITALTPLSEHYRRPGSEAVPEIAAVPERPPVSAKEDRPVAPEKNSPAPVTLTAGAVAEVRRLLAAEENPGQGLRLGVSGGGCSGLVYKTEFTERRDGDVVVDLDGFEVYLDRKSTIYLRDVVLDFQAGLGGKGFQFNNPNASNTCGCGESFAV
jgi:iron-sulfur cluster assembly protein